MGKTPLSHVDSWILVLAVISKLSGPRGRPTVEATTDGVQRVLKKIYKRDLSKRQIENILQYLQNGGFIFKEKGVLRNGRKVLYRLNSSKITQEAFKLIKIDSERAYVHDGHGYEGVIYDPPSIEVGPPETDNTGILLAWGIIVGLISVPPLVWAAVNHDWVAQQIQEGVNNISKWWNDLWGLDVQQAPDAIDSVQRHPRDPLAPKYPVDTGGSGTFARPNGGIIVRL